MSDLRSVLSEVAGERVAQNRKWGDQTSHAQGTWSMILMEEVGEVCEAVLEHQHGDWGMEGVRKELLQVAAVAVAWIQALDFNSGDGGF